MKLFSKKVLALVIVFTLLANITITNFADEENPDPKEIIIVKPASRSNG